MNFVEATELSLVGGAIRYDEPSDCVWIVNPTRDPDLVGIIHRPNRPDDKGVGAPNTGEFALWLNLHPETYTDWTPAKPERSEHDRKLVQ
jgi:hypothetical protein